MVQAEIASKIGGETCGELEPVAGGSGEFLDERRARGPLRDLPGLVDDDEPRREIGADRIPEQRERRELGDRADLGISDRAEADRDQVAVE